MRHSSLLRFLLIICIISSIDGVYAASRFNTTGINQLVGAHNNYRRAVGVKEITWSKEVAESSYNWAVELEKNSCKLEHSDENQRKGYGENLYAIWGIGGKPKYTLGGVVKSWGDEKINYNSTSGKCSEGTVCGHYSQIVWKNTTEVGCAKAKCNSGNKITEIIVCQYNPAGNYIGERAY